jgi:uncharacterized protein (TIGR02646 family)
MIRITKPQNVPRTLLTTGRRKTRKMCEAYTAHPDDYNTGEKKFSFKKDKCYNAPSVKEALKKAQHGKCCYCESKFGHVTFGDVEHFRPKNGYQQREEELVYPGYYWLAYEWRNLLASCQICNQKFKKNLFPLRDESRRARSHNDDIIFEEPLLINPAEQDPAEYIAFRKEIVYAIGGNPTGTTTIDILQLNREPLAEKRRECLKNIRLIQKSLQKLDPTIPGNREFIQEAQNFLNEAVCDYTEYAGMIRSYFNTNNQ